MMTALSVCLVAIAGLASQPGPPDAVPITFLVTVPAATPADAEIRISGGIGDLGRWDGRGLALRRLPDGRYAGTVTVPVGTFVEYKVTRGGWDTVEKDADGREIANRSVVVQRPDTLAVRVAAWRDQVPETARASTLTGDVRHHPAVGSRHLSLPRDVWVWLPPGYGDDAQRRYPVLYMHDGQNVFDAATSFIGLEWRADETAARLIAAGEIEPIIIVAVANTAERTAEYTPFAGGRGADYGRFLVEELKPLIDRTYRTRPDTSGLVGSSLGGLITLYLGFEYPEVFGRLGAMSPAVFYGGQETGLLHQLGTAARPEALIWIDAGTLEGVTPGDHASMLKGLAAVREALLARGFLEGWDLACLVDEGAVHNEGAWAGRLDQVLRFLFPPR